MKTYFVFLIVAVTLLNVEAWVTLMPSDRGTEHLGDCYSSTEGIGSMKLGEKKQLKGGCSEVKCSENRYIEQTGCVSDLVNRPGCQILPEDLSKPYPDCCPQLSCANN
ncbi:la1-like protein 13 [Diabrotica undecimpunctata]|uniref:la1-like protein 13 n=1 Tax=Diabrotica undecimpunctata TaxID=50387 RepID=UPI003B63A751